MRTIIITIFTLLLFSCHEDNVINVKLGDRYNGGTVFYIFKEDDIFYIPNETHGLIAYEKDTISIWANESILVNGDERIGGGEINNQEIMNKSTISAALLCYSLGKGWYLPNQKELSALSDKRLLLSNLKQGLYWSSTNGKETYEGVAVNVYTNGYGNVKRNEKLLVRPIKQF